MASPSVHLRQRAARAAMFAITVVVIVAVALSCATPARQSTSISRPAFKAKAQAAPAEASDIDEKALRLAGVRMGLRHPVAPAVNRSPDAVAVLNASCVNCHGEYGGADNHAMHASGNVSVSCVDCHGGNTKLDVPAGITAGHPQFDVLKYMAHVAPRPQTRDIWTVGGRLSSANPSAPGAATLKESLDYIRFVNPGDLHVARAACGGCHNNDAYGYINDRVEKSMMTHGAMLWGAALYNNGAHNRKDPVYGEAYAPAYDSVKDGGASLVPAMIVASTDPAKLPTAEETLKRGLLPRLLPLTRWEVTQPGNILRVFERGGDRLPNLGVPDPFDPPGKPDVKLSTRGLGTNLRTDPVYLGLQKTRLFDPTLNLFGTNDHAGDYRGSGCTACHVVYANDRSPVHSGSYAQFGNSGRRAPNSTDKVIPRDESGHPAHHVFAPRNGIPSSQCIVCHVHPGTNVVNAYLGFTWWDNETHAEFMYPAEQQHPTDEQKRRVEKHNPEGSAPRGLWSDIHAGKKDHRGNAAPRDFLAQTGTPEFNAKLDKTQFADFHGHGWVYRAVFKRDRAGNLLDGDDNVIAEVTPQKLAAAVAHADPAGRPTDPGTPVHLKDIHLERGMHCVDCHFEQDSHGDGKLYGETRAATMITCADCHGTTTEAAAIKLYREEEAKDEDDRDPDAMAALRGRLFTGNATPREADLDRMIGRFSVNDDGELVQQARVTRDADGELARWKVPQVVPQGDPPADRNAYVTEDPSVERRRRALYAHTVRKDNKTWGTLPGDQEKDDPNLALAHGSNMSCYACHTSWNTSCFGCHLPMKSNDRTPMLHNEGQTERNYTNYNFQTIRDDVYMLGIDSTVKGGGIVPVRSACAVLVSSQDANRQWLYTQQQTISAEGFAGTAFSPYFPHTVRTTETKRCTDCHVSVRDDNNAILGQLMLLGTKSVNFMGRFAFVGMGSRGLEAVAITERDEPQAVIGSRLHEFAYPDDHAAHERRGRRLTESHPKEGFTIHDLQQRGEYLYAAAGRDGFIAFDIANLDNKAFSERIITAPASPAGQRLYIRTKNATSVCTPSTLAIDPTRPRRPENQEGPIAPLYAFLYVTDSEEGLVVIGNPPDDTRHGAGVSTLLDGDPNNNFLAKALSFNPGGALDGARWMRLHGNYAYICCDAGVRVVDLADPLKPRLLDTPGLAGFRDARRVFFQFRYAFVVDADGLKVVDVTFPEQPRLVSGAAVPIADARDLYVTRTYGYVAAGKEGLILIDLTEPESPKLVERFSQGLIDSTAVRVGMTNASLFAYVADGIGGLKVLQLTSADDRDGTPTFLGFSPRPRPRLIASFPTRGAATSLGEGLDRDRAVDEAGQQLAVFGRRGSRPFNLAEMRRLYLRDTPAGPAVWRVSDTPPAREK